MASRLQDVILRGLAAAKPLATATAPGTLYFSSDVGTLERSNGTTWDSYSGALSSSEIPFASLPVTPAVGTLANVNNSTTETPGATMTGGGTFHVLGRWNGTIWRVIG